MGLANQFNDIIQKHLNVYAAWLPVTNNYSLGDYGIFSDGVFTKIGNIKEFNAAFTEAKGPDATLDFTSSDTKVIKFSGGAQVDVIPEGAVNAKIVFKFQKERSFIVKAPTITVSAIENVNQVATQLKKASGWQRKFKVVFQIYNAIDPAIISNISADTELTFNGDAKALKNLKLGDAALEITSNKELGLNVHGQAGIIALGLFKLKLIGGGVNTLGMDEKEGPAEVIYQPPVENDL